MGFELNLIHVLAIALGVGIDTAGAILFFMTQKRPELAYAATQFDKPYAIILWVINILMIVAHYGAIILKSISGEAISSLLWLMSIFVIPGITISALLITFYFLPRYEKSISKKQKPSNEFLRIRTKLNLVIFVNLAFWYIGAFLLISSMS